MNLVSSDVRCNLISLADAGQAGNEREEEEEEEEDEVERGL